MLEIIKNVKNGERHASDIVGFALWWIGKTFWFWVLLAVLGAGIAILFHV